MSDSSKRDPLLSKGAQKRNRAPYRCDDWWQDSDSSSSSSECSSTSGQSQEEWEQHVNSKGEVFFFKPLSKQPPQTAGTLREDARKENAPVEKGILVKLIRRRSSRRSTRKKEKDETLSRNHDKSERAPQNQEQGQRKVLTDVTIRVSPDRTGTLGRRTTPLENLLGLVTIVDGSTLIISGFMSSFTKFYEGKVQIGDLLHSIDGYEVSSRNLDSILATIISPREVVLTFENMEGSPQESGYSAEPSSRRSSTKESQVGFAVLYAKLDLIEEGGPPDQGIAYSFPHLSNPLSPIRGAFLTLHQLLPDVVVTHPVSTTYKSKNQTVHLVYSYEGKEVLLLSLPEARFTLKEAVQINLDIVRCLCFTYQTLSKSP